MDEESDDWLQATLTPEDWGGDGRSRMNLSRRRTAIASQHLPRQYQFFDTQTVPSKKWQISGVQEQHQTTTHQSLSWQENGASTAKVVLPPQFTIPAGRFTADLEIFILSGAIQIGEWKLRKHCYSFIPAGVSVGDWKVLHGEAAELLWMENDRLHYQNLPTHPEARISEFIPVLDSKLLPWGKPNTTQFVAANKKWLRKTANGGVWLLTLLPHYDSQQMMIQAYNEEAYCLVGSCDIGNYTFSKGHFAYCSSFSTVPRHISEDGCLFLIRVDRDLSQAEAVLSYSHEWD